MTDKTPCQCSKPGFCPLMNRKMHTGWHKLCQTNQAYYEMFLEDAHKRSGECGLGDMLAAVFDWLRVPRLMRRLGIKSCGCGQRRDRLNRWAAPWLARVRRLKSRLNRYTVKR